jgi:hypothetical protein
MDGSSGLRFVNGAPVLAAVQLKSMITAIIPQS